MVVKEDDNVDDDDHDDSDDDYVNQAWTNVKEWQVCEDHLTTNPSKPELEILKFLNIKKTRNKHTSLNNT